MTTVEIWGARAGQTQSRLFEEIRQCREAGQRVLLLVPEQYTLQAERAKFLFHSIVRLANLHRSRHQLQPCQKKLQSLQTHHESFVPDFRIVYGAWCHLFCILSSADG